MTRIETDAIIVRHSGMFRPGVSGNPSGRPRSDATIRDLARKHTESALQVLADIIQDDKTSSSARVQAACAILDRGWGKPPQYIESLSVGGSLQDWLKQLVDSESGNASSDLLSLEPPVQSQAEGGAT